MDLRLKTSKPAHRALDFIIGFISAIILAWAYGIGCTQASFVHQNERAVVSQGLGTQNLPSTAGGQSIRFELREGCHVICDKLPKEATSEKTSTADTSAAALIPELQPIAASATLSPSSSSPTGTPTPTPTPSSSPSSSVQPSASASTVPVAPPQQLCDRPYASSTDPSNQRSKEAVFLLTTALNRKVLHSLADLRACGGRDVYVVIPEPRLVAEYPKSDVTNASLLSVHSPPNPLPGDETPGIHLNCIHGADVGDQGAGQIPVVFPDWEPGLVTAKWFGMSVDNVIAATGQPFPKVIGMDAATWFLYHNQDKYDRAWFIEDDVGWQRHTSVCDYMQKYESDDADYIAFRVAATRDEQPNWVWWKFAEFWPPEQRAGGFNPIFRGSGKLMNAISKYREGHERYPFMEVLFASSANANGLKIRWLDQSDVRVIRCCGNVGRHEFIGAGNELFHPWKEPEPACTG